MTKRKEGGYWILLREETESKSFISTIGLFEPKQKSFKRINHNLKEEFFNTTVEDETGNLWLGVWGKGLHKISPPFYFQKDEPTSIIQSIAMAKNISYGFARGFLIDNFGNLWVATRHKYLFKFDLRASSKLSYIELRTDSMSDLFNLYDIHEDNLGNIWAGFEN